MTQIEIFSNGNHDILQKNVNDFLSEVGESGGKVLDVKFQTAYKESGSTGFDCPRMEYSVMVVYEDEE